MIGAAYALTWAPKPPRFCITILRTRTLGVDAKHVALQGHSRYGKATIVAMAYNQRFWTAYVSSSGEGGAKLHRRNWGELVENVAAPNEYHWMAGNFLKYSGPLRVQGPARGFASTGSAVRPSPGVSQCGRDAKVTVGSTPRAPSWLE